MFHRRVSGFTDVRAKSLAFITFPARTVWHDARLTASKP
jgi:hypothetical protein